MKKIFLTSGLVLCMACPAFAAVNDGNANIADGAETANCVESVLETSTDGSTANFVALFRENIGTVDLDSSYTRTTNCTDASLSTVTHSDADTLAAPDPLYTRYDVGVYGTSARTSAITSLTQTPILAGYTFGGYYTEQNGAGTQYIDNNGTFDSGLKNLVTTDEGNATLYAKWTPKTHTITYACGTSEQLALANHPATKDGQSTTQTVTHDDCYNLVGGATQCEWEGHTFTGWSCTNNVDPAGGVYTVDNDTTCTAQWTTHTIGLSWTVDGTAYNAGTPSTSCTYDTAISTLPTEPSKTGYTFTGWDVVSVTPPAQGN